MESQDLKSDAVEAAQQCYVSSMVDQLEKNYVISIEEFPAVNSPIHSPICSPIHSPTCEYE